MYHSARSVCMIIYGEDNVELVIDRLNNHNSQFKYAYIKHDKCDELEHYHLYLYRSSPISQQTLISIKNDCSQNIFWENVKCDFGILQYLTHRNAPNKYQYRDEEVIANYEWSRTKNNGTDWGYIISMLDDGVSIRRIIQQNPKLLFSIGNLQRYREEVERDKWLELRDKDWTSTIAVEEVKQIDIF